MEVIRLAAEPKCASNMEKSIETIDNILKNGLLSKPLKALFGLGDLEHDEDFASLLAVSLIGSCDALHPFKSVLGLGPNLFVAS